jgi:hypothetical protein
MWLQYDIARETFAEIVKREFKRNPPDPVDVTGAVTGGVVKQIAKVEVTLEGVEFTHVPPIARKISDGTQIKADTMGLILKLQPMLVPLAGPKKKLAACRVTYRFSAYLENGKILFRMDYIDAAIANDPAALAYEKELRKGFKQSSRDGIPGPSVDGILEALKLDKKKHPILDVGIGLEALKAKDVDILVDISRVSDRAGAHWDAFFTKAGQTDWGNRNGHPVAFTIWSNFLVWFVEQQVKKAAIEAGAGGKFTYAKMSRRAKWGRMDMPSLIKEGFRPESLIFLASGGSCWETHGVYGTFEGEGHGSGQDADVTVDWFARFMIDPATSTMYTHVDTTVYTDISTWDYIAGFVHEIGSFVVNGFGDDEGPAPDKSACGGRKLGEHETEATAGPLVASDPNIGEFKARSLQTLRFMDEERFAKIEGKQKIGAQVFAIFAASDGFLSISGDLALPPA